jgi:hypothetical protein
MRQTGKVSGIETALCKCSGGGAIMNFWLSLLGKIAVVAVDALTRPIAPKKTPKQVAEDLADQERREWEIVRKGKN